MGNKRRHHRPDRVVSGHELSELLDALEHSPIGTRLVVCDFGSVPTGAVATESGARGGPR